LDLLARRCIPSVTRVLMPCVTNVLSKNAAPSASSEINSSSCSIASLTRISSAFPVVCRRPLRSSQKFLISSSSGAFLDDACDSSVAGYHSSRRRLLLKFHRIRIALSALIQHCSRRIGQPQGQDAAESGHTRPADFGGQSRGPLGVLATRTTHSKMCFSLVVRPLWSPATLDKTVKIVPRSGDIEQNSSPGSLFKRA
jgi:hypothetical protein